MNKVENEPLSRHTTFRVGGSARYFITPSSEAEVRQAIDFADGRKLPFMVLGRGSNFLFSDRGYPGVIIQIGEALSDIVYEDGYKVTVGAGCTLAKLSVNLADRGYAGFAYAGGIPGSVGGAVVMNAGAYGGEIKDTLKSVKVMSHTGEIKTISADKLDLGYRHSVIMDSDMIVLLAEFEFEKGDTDEIKAKMQELSAMRRQKQPLEYASAGSTFKRPEGHFAGKLIEDAGLKGYSIGGARVSEKHAGFVINTGDATATEIYTLILHIQKTVKEKFGVLLEPEVKMVGDFSWEFL